jgi:hypothetical protein
MNISDLLKPVRFALSRLTLTPEQYPDEYFVMEYQEYLDWMRARERQPDLREPVQFALFCLGWFCYAISSPEDRR